MIQVCTEVFVSVCPTNIVFYTSFTLSLSVVNHSSWILQQKLNSAGPARWDTKSCCNHVEWKGEVTDHKYSSSWTVLKHLSRNFSKNPNLRLHCSKLTCIKCIHFCSSLPNVLYAELFLPPPPPHFPPQSLQGRDLCDSTCFRRHSGITLPTRCSTARSQKLS